MTAELPFGVAIGIIVVIAAGFVRDRVKPTRLHVLMGVAMAGIGFQAVHFLEHILQAGYWLTHPSEAPWLTPWAQVGAEALAELAQQQQEGGVELLHLLGNAIFIGGVIAAIPVARRKGWPGQRALRLALWAQGLHVAEHVVLTTTWFVTGEALGISNAFGLLGTTPVVASAARVWIHFFLNLVATVFAVRGIQAAGLATWLRPLVARPAAVGHLEAGTTDSEDGEVQPSDDSHRDPDARDPAGMSSSAS